MIKWRVNSFETCTYAYYTDDDAIFDKRICTKACDGVCHGICQHYKRWRLLKYDWEGKYNEGTMGIQ